MYKDSPPVRANELIASPPFGAQTRPRSPRAAIDVIFSTPASVGVTLRFLDERRHANTSPATEVTEQTRRRAFNEDVRVSLALGITTEKVVERREQSALDWMSWLTEKMSEQKADDPQASAGITALN